MNEAPKPLDRLATFLDDIMGSGLPDTDILDMLDMLRPFLPGPAFEELSLSFDMCPIHNQDLDSCADDDTDNDENEIEGMQPLNTPVLAACRHLRTRP